LTQAQLAWLADNGDILDLDDQARGLDAADLATFAASLRTAINANDAAAVGKLIAGEV
jgi:Ser/Thr protein kinase RdoA (MazF antagonist)